MSGLTRDGTAEPISRDQILGRERGQGNIHFACSADHAQDWQHYPVDQYSATCVMTIYIVGMGKKGRAFIDLWDCLKRQHPWLELP